MIITCFFKAKTWKVFEDTSTNWTYENVTKQAKAALQKQNSLNGTWGVMNETGYRLGPMSNQSGGIGTGGTITFSEGRFVQNDQPLLPVRR